MKLGINLGYSGAQMSDVLPLVKLADRSGVDSLWVAEAYGSDAVTVLSYLAGQTEHIALGSAIMQMPARTPANTAMTAMTLDALSAGRVILGLGVSGPQVVEGWHGVSYRKPLAKTREYIEIVRRVIARDEPLAFDGEHYQIPYRGPGASGLGKPLKSILHPVRPRIPIYLAAIGRRNVALAAEIADGWLPIFYSPEHEGVFAESMRAGFDAAGDRDSAGFEIAATVMVAAGADLDACRDRLRPYFALYIGGMGSRELNFYNDLAGRYGYEQEAAAIQDAYLDGRHGDAVAAVPDALIDEVALVGPVERIIDRLDAWRATRVTTLILGTDQPEVVQAVRDTMPGE